MRNLLTPIALALALTVTAAAHAGAANDADDLYREASRGPHTALAGQTDASRTASGDLYREAIWDVQASRDDQQTAAAMLEQQRAANGRRAAGQTGFNLNTVE